MIALFIVFLVLIILLGIFLILYYPIKRYLDTKKYKELVGKKLYKLALNKDYYLLNNLVIKIDDEITLHVDHLLCANKYIYVIVDRYIPIGVSGRTEDNTWFNYFKKNKKKAIRNLVLYNEERTIRLAKFLGWNESKTPMLISVVCLNDSVILSDELENFDHKYSFLVKKKNLCKVIEKTEEDAQVSPLDEENLDKLVKTIHELSITNENE